MKYVFLRGVMRMLCRIILFRRVHIEGQEHIPSSGGVLVVGNHVGAIDPPLAGAVIDRTDVYFMAKSEHFSTPFKRWICTGYHAFAVNRGTADRRALKHSLDLLEAGKMLVLYPEGTRGPALRKPQGGAGFIAAKSSAVILPVAVWGTEKVLSKGETLPHRAHVYVKFGPAFVMPESLRQSRDHGQQADYLMAKIAELLPLEYRGIYQARVTVA